MSIDIQQVTRTPMTYVFDAYCGWCYGFDTAFSSFVAEHRDQIDLTIISGGLFTDARVVPMVSMPYIAASNDRITTLTGARFGAGYLRAAADPTFTMDSTDAAAGFAAMRHLAPGRAFEIAVEMQRSFYVDGQSLSDGATYQAIASRLDLDADAVLAALDSPRARADAQEDFRRARSLGVDSFPTVLVELADGGTGRLGGPASTAEQLAVTFAALRQRGTEADTRPTTDGTA